MSSTSPDLQPPPPEADLIRVARLARGLSPEKAAELAPIRLGGARWRHIERGYEPKKPPLRVRAPDKTLAHMAHVVGVSPERLDEVDRGLAAEILREIIRKEAEASPPGKQVFTSREMEILEDLAASTAERLGLTPEQAAEALRRAQARITQKRAAVAQQEEPPQTPRGRRAI